MPEKDYYKTLGVSAEASQEEIRKAYRRLAKQHHPDRHRGSKAAEEKFKDAAEAYSVLGDPQKRRQYDRLRQVGMHGGWHEAGPSFEDLFSGLGGRTWHAGEDVNFRDYGSLGDLFSRIFGGARGRAEHAARQRGHDVASAISVPFDVAVHGGRAEVKVPRERACPECGGTGAAGGAGVETCAQCRGSGQVLSGQGAFSVARPCPACFGRGRIIRRPCGKCRGGGTLEEPVLVEVKVPAGVEDGQRMRLAGLGQPGVGGGPNGDLLLEVRVQPHPAFARRGRDIHSKVQVNMVDAALGTQVEIQTLRGTVTVTVPPGTQPGQRLRIAGYGLQTADGKKGHHYVEVQVRIPRSLTEEQRRLLEQLRGVPAGAKS